MQGIYWKEKTEARKTGRKCVILSGGGNPENAKFSPIFLSEIRGKFDSCYFSL